MKKQKQKKAAQEESYSGFGSSLQNSYDRYEPKDLKVTNPLGRKLILIISFLFIVALGAVTYLVSFFVSQDVKISAEEGNIISVKEDGLFASVEDVDISGKADKLVNPEDGEPIIKAGQIFIDDGNGNLAASGITIDELKSTVSDEVMGNFDTETDVDS